MLALKSLPAAKSLNLTTSEVISTYVYKIGLAGGVANFSYAAAIGLFNSVMMLLAANQLSKSFCTQTSIFEWRILRLPRFDEGAQTHHDNND